MIHQDGSPMTGQEASDDRVRRLRRVTRRRWMRRWILRAAGLVVVALLSIGVGLAWLTVHPRVNSAPHVDALLVLATQPGAQEEGYRLGEEGVTELLIVSAPEGAVYDSLCDDPPSETEVVCFEPAPVTTQGEAIKGTDIARQHGAESLGVLTFDHHIERSRLLVDRCWDRPVHMYEFQTERSGGGYAYDFVYAMAAYGKTFLTPGCSSEEPIEWLQTPIDKLKLDR